MPTNLKRTIIRKIYLSRIKWPYNYKEIEAMPPYTQKARWFYKQVQPTFKE